EFLFEKCWKCQREIDRFECTTHCPCEKNVLLPVKREIDYFRLFHLPKSFELDVNLLTKAFRTKMKLLHPDLFANKSSEDQQYSQDQSSYLNEAYSTLHSPLERALYLLKLENIIFEETTTTLDPDFLMKIMEMNEELADDKTIKHFPTNLAIEIRQEMDSLLKQLSNTLHKMDLPKAKELVGKLNYYTNLDDKIKSLELKHGIL
ncbi:unnamed protein product, partial [Didymodactylos carnosus]